ncbi:MAG: hypothetical protein NTW03_13220, partial [Verrucomicrobia bacterium]|nr:hypothetical protein [Verrucomicrobiota bacterium]
CADDYFHGIPGAMVGVSSSFEPKEKQAVRQTLALTGRVRTNSDASSQVRARREHFWLRLRLSVPLCLCG